MTDVLDIDISLQGGNLVRADLLDVSARQAARQPARATARYPARRPTTSTAAACAPECRQRAEPSRDVHEPAHGVPTCAGCVGAARAAHLDATGGHHGDEDLRVPPGSLRRRARSTRSTTARRASGPAPPTCSSCGTSSSRSARCSTSRAMPIGVPPSSTERATQKLDIEDDDDAKFAHGVTDGWMASMQHHFVSAAVPPKGEEYHFTLTREGEHSVVSYRGPLKTVPAGTTGRFSETLFVGPKLQDQLKHGRPEARADGRLRQAHDHRRAAVLAAAESARTSSATGAGRSSSSRSC